MENLKYLIVSKDKDGRLLVSPGFGGDYQSYLDNLEITKRQSANDVLFARANLSDKQYTLALEISKQCEDKLFSEVSDKYNTLINKLIEAENE